MNKLRYHSSFYLPEKPTQKEIGIKQFQPEDFEYIRRQILDQRSLNSSERTNNVTVSLIYEATNTFLKALEYISRVCIYGITISVFDSLTLSDLDHYVPLMEYIRELDLPIDISSGFAIIVADCSQMEYDNDLKQYIAINGKIVNLFYYDTVEKNYIFHQEFQAKNIIAESDNGVTQTHISHIYTNRISLNSNGIAYYHENFPMPTLYQIMIQSSFVDNILQEYKKTIITTEAGEH